MSSPTTIEEMIRQQRAGINKRKQARPLAVLRAEIAEQTRPQYLLSHLTGPDLAVISRLKTARLVNEQGIPFDTPVARAMRLQRIGVAALLVETNDPKSLHAVCNHTRLPVIHRDVVIDPYQIYEACAAGADGITLMAGLLDDTLLYEALSITQRLIMTALIEIHTDEDLERVLPLSPRLIGINNRDIETGQVDLGVSAHLRDKIPPPTTIVSLGGIVSSDAIQMAADIGVHAVCIDEELVLTGDKSGGNGLLESISLP
jgi:indole-3-glycerol phosphate synthase